MNSHSNNSSSLSESTLDSNASTNKRRDFSSDMVQYIEKAIEIAKNEVNNRLESEVNIINTKINDELDKISKREFNAIQTLGVFVALLTFISGSISIMKGFTDFKNAGIFTILVGCLSGFILLNIVIILRISRDEKGWPGLIALLILYISLSTGILVSINTLIH
jgi:hypothetical protein